MKSLLTILVLAVALPAHAANLYAKASGGNWTDASTWSTTGCAGGDNSGPPGETTDVIIEACAGVILVDSANPSAKTVDIAPSARVSTSPTECVIASDCLLYLFGPTGTVWRADTDAVLDLTATTIVLYGNYGAPSGTRTFAGGSHVYGVLEIDDFNSAQIVALTGANTFADIFTSTDLLVSHPVLMLPASLTTTVFNFEPSGGGADGQYWDLRSSSAGVAATLTKSSGTIDVQVGVITDIAATGGATWCAGTTASNGGGTTGWQYVSCPVHPQLNLLGTGR